MRLEELDLLDDKRAEEAVEAEADTPNADAASGVEESSACPWPAPVPVFSYLAGAAGCLVGDTTVRYNRGARNSMRSLPLWLFYRKFNGLRARTPWSNLDQPTYLYSLADSGALFKNRVVAVVESGVKETVTVQFVDGTTVSATPDHPFLSAGDAGFVEAQALRVGQHVVARGKLLSVAHGGHYESPPRVIVNVKYHPFGARKIIKYANVGGPVGSERQYQYTRIYRARLVVEAALNNIEYDEYVTCLKTDPLSLVRFSFLPSDLEVHHRDENTLNDTLNNLQVLSTEAHARLHSKEENFGKEYVRDLAVQNVVRANHEMTYDIQMADPARNFFANDVLVHNSGKTFLTKAWAAEDSGIELCASTGIAALNLGGTTINALLGYFDTESLRESYTHGFLTARLGKLWRAGVRRIVVDECSMVPAEQLTYLVRAILELAGRGYVLKSFDEDDDDKGPRTMGLTLVGDFAQLGPVKAAYAFESPEWVRFIDGTKTLTEVRRQADPAFIAALRAARRGEGDEALAYFGPRLQERTDDHFDGPTILAKNDAVDRFNRLRLDALPGAPVRFGSARWGKQRAEWGNPEKPKESWGVPDVLELKEGALVMVLANKRSLLSRKFVYVNGNLGTLLGSETRQDEEGRDVAVAVVRLQSGQEVGVEYVQRTVKIPCDSARRSELRAQDLGHLIDGKYEIQGGISYMPLRVAYAATCHKCVTADTRVLVEKRGSIRVDQLVVGDWVDTGSGPARVVAIKQTFQHLCCLTTSRGYQVTCSPDHRWKTPDRADDSFTPTEQLRSGTRVLLTRESTVQGTQAIDADTAWWIGATLGDGSWTDRREGQIHFTSSTPELRARWMRIAQRYGGRPNTRKDERGCHLTNLPWRLRLEQWGCQYVTAVHKRIPSIIWESGPLAWGACLQGLFDTDGSASDGRCLYATRSPRMADDIQLLLLYLGIPSTRGSYQGRTGLYYHIRVSAEGRYRFCARVGASHPRKKTALQAWKPNRELKPYDGTDTVKTVTEAGLAVPMFDIELETVHELGWGPIVGSNSQGLSLDKVQVNIRDAFFKTPAMLYVALSRARTVEGLRLVGSAAAFVERCTTDPKLRGFL